MKTFPSGYSLPRSSLFSQLQSANEQGNFYAFSINSGVNCKFSSTSMPFNLPPFRKFYVLNLSIPCCTILYCKYYSITISPWSPLIKIFTYCFGKDVRVHLDRRAGWPEGNSGYAIGKQWEQYVAQSFQLTHVSTKIRHSFGAHTISFSNEFKCGAGRGMYESGMSTKETRSNTIKINLTMKSTLQPGSII